MQGRTDVAKKVDPPRQPNSWLLGQNKPSAHTMCPCPCVETSSTSTCPELLANIVLILANFMLQLAIGFSKMDTSLMISCHIAVVVGSALQCINLLILNDAYGHCRDSRF